MAETPENTRKDLVEADGLYYTQDFSLNKLNILVSSGKKFEMKRLLVEMSYYEDIYSFAVSGYLTLNDSQGFIETLQLTGNEFIEVEFGKLKSSGAVDSQTFRIYKIGNRTPKGNFNGEIYTIYFCSEELMLSEQMKISRAYSGYKISDIVKDVLIEKLNVPPNKIKIDATKGLYDFVVPKLKPFETLSWLSTYAIPDTMGSISADMLFFENQYGFNYRSLRSMFAEPIYATYKYQQQNLDLKTQSPQEKFTSVLQYEFVKSFDTLGDTSAGTYANRLISIDPLTRSYKITDFDSFNPSANMLNSNPAFNFSKNRFGKTQNQMYEASLKVVTSNASEKFIPYISSRVGSVANDIRIETYVPMRTAAINLANYIVAKLIIPGDAGITAGRTINFNLMSVKPTINDRDLDKIYSGKYLVTAVRHIIQNNIYQTILEIAKDSSPTRLGGIDNNDPNRIAAAKQ